MAISTFLPLLFIPLALVWLLPFFTEAGGFLRAALTARPAPQPPDGSASQNRKKLLFLVPAHNESTMITPAVEALVRLGRERSDHSVWVIADNCDDDTAKLAAGAGAQVLVRNDRERPGKPHAIQYAMDQLLEPAIDAVVIVDADTLLQEDYGDILAGHANLREIAIQPCFKLSNESETWMSRLSGLLGRVRTDGQYLLKSRADLNCPVTGDGLCIGTTLLARCGWVTDSLTENWELYARYTAAGETILFEPKAVLRFHEAASFDEAGTQRRRWLAGRLMTMANNWRSLVGSRRISVLQKIDVLSEITAVGPVLHTLIALVGLTAMALTRSTVGYAVSIGFAVSLMPLAFWTTKIWWRDPARWQLFKDFAQLPRYTIWRAVQAILTVGTGYRGVWRRSPRRKAAGG